MTDHPIPARPSLAATLMLLRDGPQGIEVLMMVRHDNAKFAGGAIVFPGGRVEPTDDALAARQDSEDTAALALKVAAIRETYEECGVLLARASGTSTLLPPAALTESIPDPDFGGWLERRQFELATDLLVPFANWITPIQSPKRFDTHFFIAEAAFEQIPRHDGHEAVEVLWTLPETVIADMKSGIRMMLPPTLLNLRRLASCATVAEALAAARERPPFVVRPELVKTEHGIELRIPEAAGYGITSMPTQMPRGFGPA